MFPQSVWKCVQQNDPDTLLTELRRLRKQHRIRVDQPQQQQQQQQQQKFHANDDRDALLLAVQKRNVQSVRVLLGFLEADEINQGGYVLHEVVRHASTTTQQITEAMLTLLLDAKADVQRLDEEGNSALHTALVACYSMQTSPFVAHLASVCANVRNNRGETALFSHLYGHKRRATLRQGCWCPVLLKAQTDLTLKDKYGTRLLDLQAPKPHPVYSLSQGCIRCYRKLQHHLSQQQL
jgi:hypothetical protein